MTRALTLWQPWASLIAIGAKTIETRSWSTAYRGPLLIHAGASTAGIDQLPGDCEGSEEDGWRYGYVGDWQASYCYCSGDTGTRGEAEMIYDGPDHRFDWIDDRLALPLGAVVASVVLADCVPIGPPFDREGIGDPYDCAVVQENGEMYVYRGLNPERGTDQLPYGDFTPGRYAWLLDDMKPTIERCPRCWGTGALPTGAVKPAGPHFYPCPNCAGEGVCDPVPARGHQGLWEWKP